MRNRKLLLTTISLLIISILFLSPFVAAANSDSSADDNIFSEIFNFFKNLFSGEKLTGDVIFTPADCDVNAPGMVSYWTFNAGDAKDDYDGNNGTVNGATPTTGKVGGAMSFDGVDDYVDFGNPTNLQSSDPMTVEFWFERTVATGSYPTLISHGRNGWVVGINSDKLFVSKSGSAPYVVGSTTLTNGQWYHVVFVRNGATSTLYLNGAVEGSSGATPTFDYTNKIQLAKDDYPTWDFFNGTIDEVAIFNRALTSTEIQQMYSKGVSGKSYCEAPMSTPDTTPPVRSNGAPTGTIITSSTTLSLTTDENAVCRYSTTSGTAFTSMAQFSTTGSTSHSQSLTGLTNGNYNYYVKCNDSAGNINPDDYTVSPKQRTK